MGCAVQIHQGSERLASWAANAIDGWYLQTSPEHYRCHVIYVKQTKNERVSDTVFFKTKYITQPTLTRADIISKALNNLTQAIKGKRKKQKRIRAIRRTQKVRHNPQQRTRSNPSNNDKRADAEENNIRQNSQGTSRNRAKRSSTNTKGDQAAPKDTKRANPQGHDRQNNTKNANSKGAKQERDEGHHTSQN